MKHNSWLSPVIALVAVFYLTLAGVLGASQTSCSVARPDEFYLYPIQTSGVGSPVQERFGGLALIRLAPGPAVGISTVDSETGPADINPAPEPETPESQTPVPEPSAAGPVSETSVIPAPETSPAPSPATETSAITTANPSSTVPDTLPVVTAEATPTAQPQPSGPVHWDMPAYQTCVLCHVAGAPPIPGSSLPAGPGTSPVTGPGTGDPVVEPTPGTITLPFVHPNDPNCIACHVTVPTETPPGTQTPEEPGTVPPGITTTDPIAPPFVHPSDPNCASCHATIPTTPPPGTPPDPGTVPPNTTTPGRTTTTPPPADLPPTHPNIGSLACTSCHAGGIPTVTTPATTSPRTTTTTPRTTTTTPPPATTAPAAHYLLAAYRNCSSCHGTNIPPIPTTTAPRTTTTTSPLPPGHPNIGTQACTNCHRTVPTVTTTTTRTTTTTAPRTTTTTAPRTTTTAPTQTLPRNHPNTYGRPCTYCHDRDDD